MSKPCEVVAMHVKVDRIDLRTIRCGISHRADPDEESRTSRCLSLVLDELEIFPSEKSEYTLEVVLINRDLTEFENRERLLVAQVSVEDSLVMPLRHLAPVSVDLTISACEKSILVLIHTESLIRYWVVFPLLVTLQGRHRLPLNRTTSASADIRHHLLSPHSRNRVRSTSYFSFTLIPQPSGIENALVTIEEEPIVVQHPPVSLIPSYIHRTIHPSLFDYHSCVEVQLSPSCAYLALRLEQGGIYVFRLTDSTPLVYAVADPCCIGMGWMDDHELVVGIQGGLERLLNLQTLDLLDTDSCGRMWPIPTSSAASPDGRLIAHGGDDGRLVFHRPNHETIHVSETVFPAPVVSVSWMGDCVACIARTVERATSLPVVVLSVTPAKRCMSKHLQQWGDEWTTRRTHKIHILMDVIEERLV
jgi:hypothetical protein